jgi:hypothetical protein
MVHGWIHWWIIWPTSNNKKLQHTKYWYGATPRPSGWKLFDCICLSMLTIISILNLSSKMHALLLLSYPIDAVIEVRYLFIFCCFQLHLIFYFCILCLVFCDLILRHSLHLNKIGKKSNTNKKKDNGHIKQQMKLTKYYVQIVIECLLCIANVNFYRIFQLYFYILYVAIYLR